MLLSPGRGWAGRPDGGGGQDGEGGDGWGCEERPRPPGGGRHHPQVRSLPLPIELLNFDIDSLMNTQYLEKAKKVQTMWLIKQHSHSHLLSEIFTDRRLYWIFDIVYSSLCQCRRQNWGILLARYEPENSIHGQLSKDIDLKLATEQLRLSKL